MFVGVTRSIQASFDADLPRLDVRQRLMRPCLFHHNQITADFRKTSGVFVDGDTSTYCLRNDR